MGTQRASQVAVYQMVQGLQILKGKLLFQQCTGSTLHPMRMITRQNFCLPSNCPCVTAVNSIAMLEKLLGVVATMSQAV